MKTAISASRKNGGWAYVGITRARERAFISHVANRHLQGSWINALPSRFLNELPDENVDRRSSINFGGHGGGQGASNAWQRERKERVPPLWEQLRAGQMSRDQRGIPPRLRPTEIEGKAYEVQPQPPRKAN